MNEKNKSKGHSIKQEVKFTDLLNLFLSKLVWLCLAGIIGAVVTGFFVKVFVTPKYESYITMYVHNDAVSTNTSSVINNNDLLAAESLAGTYKIILQSNVLLDAVIEEVNSDEKLSLERPLSREVVTDMLNVSTVDDTQLLKVSIQSSDAVLAYKVANAFATVSEEQIVRVTKAGGVEVVDKAELSYTPVSPKVIIDCILGFMVGAVIAAVYFIIRMISDTTVYLTADVENITDIPVYGAIPDIKETENEDYEWKLLCTKILSYEGGYGDEDIQAEMSK